MNVTLFTDGSALGNPGPGGWATLLRCNGRETLLAGGYPGMTTNNRMELTAVLEGLRTLESPCQVTVVTDSEYVRGVLSLGWKRKANQDLLRELDGLLLLHEVSCEVVRAHSGHPENERVDAAARKEAEQARVSLPPHSPQPCANCRVPGHTGRCGTIQTCQAEPPLALPLFDPDLEHSRRA